jgi:hypothetical protein
MADKTADEIAKMKQRRNVPQAQAERAFHSLEVF